ncbi:maleate isomerase [Cognatiyoonia koreensis]|uniref:Maleate isomerase n=1 Tax=Cognatiyoonia koreensis TaxID=364200 RepID=A0A1I0QWS5_9RHOB|nr:aspartate/glutamate racemase family protein [Cognatiyoonia koreensis]SEW31977.1 maleate isomerase [Cognatiyoonia koreensis]
MTPKAPYRYHAPPLLRPTLGVVVLAADETIESDLRHYFPAEIDWFTTRVGSSTEVSSQSLADIASRIGPAASLFPHGRKFKAIAYACTSGAAEIGPDGVASRIKANADTESVTDPVTALVAACGALGIKRLGLLSPYVASVSQKLRNVLLDNGIATPVFGSFEVAKEATVVRIDAQSINDAALDLMAGADVDALFLSCTNLQTRDVIAPLEHALGKPVLTSNQVLAWHMMHLTQAGTIVADGGRLFNEHGRAGTRG